MTEQIPRSDYFDGMRLQAADLRCQQDYLDGLRHRSALGLAGSGVSEGLDVVGARRAVQVLPGIAIDPAGRLIALDRMLVVPAPEGGMGVFDLFLSLEETAAGARSGTLDPGPERIARSVVPRFLARGVSVPEDLVFLASVTFDDEGVVQALDPSARQYCGWNAGWIDVLAPPEGLRVASLSARADADGCALAVQADRVDLDGIVTVAGGLSTTAQPRRGAFDLVTGGPVAAMTGTGGAGVLDIDAEGRSWLGPEPEAVRSARLTVSGGVALGAGRAIRFGRGGGLTWNGGASALRFDSHADGRATVTLTSPQGMTMQAGGAGPDWVTTPDGKVGIGLTQPDCALSVAGKVQALSGGFEIGTTPVQRTAATSTSVMVGAIVDWWRARDDWPVPEGYAICNGDPFPDDSPLAPGNLPDLDGVYLIGADSPGEVGRPPDHCQPHSHPMDATARHVHGIQHTHTVTGRTDEQSDGDSDSSDDHCSSRHHSHLIDETIETCPQTESQPNDGDVPGTSSTAQTALPPSVRFVKLMRVR